MGKFQRYFEQDSKNQNVEEKTPDVITYNVAPKVKPWGRRQADRIQNRKKEKLKSKQPKPKGKVKVSKELLKKHGRGQGIHLSGVRTGIHKKRFENKEKLIKFATDQAARSEILLTEQHGSLEADEGETTTQFTQKEIRENVDITAATKSFDLKLEFGPYRMKYTKNGRHLLLGGKKGHVAAFDWITKKLHCEMNVMESVDDISWLHIETMFAVAQKEWVYIYDNQGIELHCIKRLNRVTRMEFLPYHFLLAACSDSGYLSWLDISIGQIIQQFNTKLGRLSMLCQNPWNAVLCLGHAKGVVSMWSPNSREPLAKMLCHKAPLTALHVDPKGQYLGTAASNREIKIWDIRKLEGPVQEYKLITAANNLNFSQKDMLAVGMGNVVEVYRDCCLKATRRQYLRHRFVTTVQNLNFCPYEDVLGVGTTSGVSSLLVPGCGEANFDAYEANPFQTKSQRREAEVKSLLEKIQPELISLDPSTIAEVDAPGLREKLEAKQKLMFVKPPKINYTPRNKALSSVKVAKNKQIVKEQAKREFVKNTRDLEMKKTKSEVEESGIFNRFRSKKR